MSLLHMVERGSQIVELMPSDRSPFADPAARAA
jgi:hypothetical protein